MGSPFGSCGTKSNMWGPTICTYQGIYQGGLEAQVGVVLEAGTPLHETSDDAWDATLAVGRALG